MTLSAFLCASNSLFGFISNSTVQEKQIDIIVYIFYHFSKAIKYHTFLPIFILREFPKYVNFKSFQTVMSFLTYKIATTAFSPFLTLLENIPNLKWCQIHTPSSLSWVFFNVDFKICFLFFSQIEF